MAGVTGVMFLAALDHIVVNEFTFSGANMRLSKGNKKFQYKKF